MQIQKHKKIKESGIGKMLEAQKKDITKFQLEFTEKVILFSIAGLGLITALAWDEVFKYLFKLISNNFNNINGKFLYAIFLTIFTTIVTILFNKFLKNKK